MVLDFLFLSREHAMLAKTAGVKHLVVLINKMDDVTVDWAETRCVYVRACVCVCLCLRTHLPHF